MARGHRRLSSTSWDLGDGYAVTFDTHARIWRVDAPTGARVLFASKSLAMRWIRLTREQRERTA
jgi:phage baseplate assembly protein gpV